MNITPLCCSHHSHMSQGDFPSGDFPPIQIYRPLSKYFHSTWMAHFNTTIGWKKATAAETEGWNVRSLLNHRCWHPVGWPQWSYSQVDTGMAIQERKEVGKSDLK